MTRTEMLASYRAAPVMAPRDLAAAGPLCEGQPVEDYYPVGAEMAKARTRLCDGCPVLGACLRHAVDHGELGIWGGTTEEERLYLRRRLQREERLYLRRRLQREERA